MHSLWSNENVMFVSVSLVTSVLVSLPIWLTRPKDEAKGAAEAPPPDRER